MRLDNTPGTEVESNQASRSSAHRWHTIILVLVSPLLVLALTGCSLADLIKPCP